jgi:energy-coupling factor transport system substrate-specific component
MTWQVVTFVGLALVLAGGFAWYEHSRPTARLIALVAALAALAVAGRLVLAPIPNVVATTDVVLITGFALGAAPGFAVGALAAPISNIWLGQGPWTAWQMAGWGMVGLGGALLAVLTRRRVNRIGLATVCAVAGFAYGALLDFSTMVTYGGEQSLDRYLALSARGLPFNVAHALGNFAIALAAGPALVRMISRFRTRLEFSWPAAEAVPSALLVILALIAVGGLGLGRTESAAAGPTAISWLRAAQSDDGGYAATPGQPSSPAMTGWTMLGLEAGGTNPLDLRSGGETPVSYLRGQVDRLRSVGDLERTILALAGAGVDPRSFAGEDLVASLRAKRDGDGSVDGQVNLTAFYALAMRAAGADPGSLKRSAAWLRRSQNPDGGWGIQPQAPSEADSSGAALQGLIAAGATGNSARAGSRWLRRAQHHDGGWALGSSGVVNSQSTAWAVQGLVATGSGVDQVDAAQRYLAQLRASDGHYRYSSASDQTPVWVTGQVLLATERKAFPLAPLARRPNPKPDTSASTPPDEPSSGSGSGSGGGAGSPGREGAGSGGGSGHGGASGSPGHGSGNGNNPQPSAGSGGSNGGASAPSAPDASPTTTTAASGGVPPPAPMAETELRAPTPDDNGGDDSTLPWLIAGFTALAAALGGGFVWYRRRLP